MSQQEQEQHHLVSTASGSGEELHSPVLLNLNTIKVAKEFNAIQLEQQQHPNSASTEHGEEEEFILDVEENDLEKNPRVLSRSSIPSTLTSNHLSDEKHHDETPIPEKKDLVLFNTPAMVLDKFKADGIRKSKLTIDQLIILSLFAGIFKGLAGAVTVITAGNSPGLEETNPGIQKFFGGAVFPIGLILINLTGSELFTGNVVIVLIGLFSRNWRSKKILIQYAQFSKNLFLTYIFNCFGAFIFAYLFMYLPQPCCSAHWIEYIKHLAEAKTNKTFGNQVLLGIICNMLVTLGVFNAAAATTVQSKIIGIWFPVMSFVSLGFEHSIANAFYIPLGMLYGANVTLYDFFIMNLLPVTIGNIIGGSFVNACLIYYVHDFRVRHKRAVFDFIEIVWKKIKDRKNDSNHSSEKPVVNSVVQTKQQVELKESI